MSAKQLLPLSGVVSVLLVMAAFIVGGESPETRRLPERRSSPTTTTTTASSRDRQRRCSPGGVLLPRSSRPRVAALLRRARPESGVASANFSLAGGIVFAVGATIFAGLGIHRRRRGRRHRPRHASRRSTPSRWTCSSRSPSAPAPSCSAPGSQTLKTDVLPEMAGLGGDRDRRHRDHTARLLRFPRARRSGR